MVSYHPDPRPSLRARLRLALQRQPRKTTSTGSYTTSGDATRLNRGGDRQGNNALWTIANNRLIHDPETRAYATKRAAEGLTRKEVLRCLKRHLARRLYPLLLADLTAAAALDLT